MHWSTLLPINEYKFWFQTSLIHTSIIPFVQRPFCWTTDQNRHIKHGHSCIVCNCYAEALMAAVPHVTSSFSYLSKGCSCTMQFSNLVFKIRVRAQQSFSRTQLVWGVTFDLTTREHSLCFVRLFLCTLTIPTNRIRLSSRISEPAPSTAWCCYHHPSSKWP